MHNWAKAAAVAALVIGVAAAIVFKERSAGPPVEGMSVPLTTEATRMGMESLAGAGVERGAENTAPAAEPGTALPRLLDLGSDKCIPCKLMAPILDELKREYAGVFQVDVIDVKKDRPAARRHGIRVIPTQIFFDRSGQELFRHQGFLSKEEVLETWKTLGVDLSDVHPESARETDGG
jgi:thioredoxin 1